VCWLWLLDLRRNCVLGLRQLPGRGQIPAASVQVSGWGAAFVVWSGDSRRFGRCRVLGAIMFTLIGLVFLKADMKPSLDPDVEASHGKGARRPQGEVIKNVLMGLTMSGINPALLASYTGAIASGKAKSCLVLMSLE
jgi:hypothetical protein